MKSLAETTMALRTGGVHLLAVLAVLSACATGQEKGPAAKGEVVTGLGKGVMYVFQAKGGDYWLGSNDQGVYRYDGKALVNFTTKDGLVSDRIRGIQEGKAGPSTSPPTRASASSTARRSPP